MAEKKVKLHGLWASLYSKRVEIALKMKGVEYEYIEEDLDNKSPDLLRYNPIHKKVPVLVHGSKPVTESQVILEYIDETWDSKTSILPRDPYKRAQARFWARFIDDKLLPLLYKVLILGEEASMEEALENMKILDKELEGKRFFGGESIGFVDIVASFVSHVLGAAEEAMGKVILTDEAFPCLWRWRDEYVKCDVVKESLPPREELIAYFRARVQVVRGHVST